MFQTPHQLQVALSKRVRDGKSERIASSIIKKSKGWEI
jgi:hypothetical protein